MTDYTPEQKEAVYRVFSIYQRACFATRADAHSKMNAIRQETDRELYYHDQELRVELKALGIAYDEASRIFSKEAHL